MLPKQFNSIDFFEHGILSGSPLFTSRFTIMTTRTVKALTFYIFLQQKTISDISGIDCVAELPIGRCFSKAKCGGSVVALEKGGVSCRLLMRESDFLTFTACTNVTPRK